MKFCKTHSGGIKNLSGHGQTELHRCATATANATATSTATVSGTATGTATGTVSLYDAFECEC